MQFLDVLQNLIPDGISGTQKRNRTAKVPFLS